MLPERIVFGDEDRFFEVRRDAAVARPMLDAARRATLRAGLTRAQLDERRRHRVRRAERPDVGQRQVDVGQQREHRGGRRREAAT